jgi:hypothetical protein
MTYFEAVSIEQDFIVAMQFADYGDRERLDAVKEVAKKYTAEQMAEAYSVIKKKKKEELQTLKALFVLAVRSKLIEEPKENKK